MKMGLIKRIVYANLLFCFMILCIANLTYADSAEVLPKGIFRGTVDTNFYFPTDKRYNPDGEVENIAVDYNKTLNSDSGVLDLSPVESAFGMPTGSGNIGYSVVSFKYYNTYANLSFQYGVTERLTTGILIPYAWRKNKVNATLNSSTATVGKSEIGASLGAPFVPLSGGGPFGDAVPLTTEDVQNYLGNGLDINGDGSIEPGLEGFGYDRVETWSGSGIGDIEAGGRYQYYKTDDWRLAFTGGLRFPTGNVDDRDNLTDLPFGEGAYVLLFRFNNDYTRIKNLVLNGTVKYDVYLPAEIEKRVPKDVNKPLNKNKERVDRTIGNYAELEASGKYTLTKGFDLSLLYKHGFAAQDRVSGDKGYAYESLEKETEFRDHTAIAGISYSTLPLYMEKKFSIPFTVSFSYRNRFAGANNALKSQYIALGLETYF